jgi:hypothetical protein
VRASGIQKEREMRGKRGEEKRRQPVASWDAKHETACNGVKLGRNAMGEDIAQFGRSRSDFSLKWVDTKHGGERDGTLCGF